MNGRSSRAGVAAVIIALAKNDNSKLLSVAFVGFGARGITFALAEAGLWSE